MLDCVEVPDSVSDGICERVSDGERDCDCERVPDREASWVNVRVSVALGVPVIEGEGVALHDELSL